MKFCSNLLFIAVLLSGSAYAEKSIAAPVKELQVLANNQQLLKNSEEQVDGMLTNALEGKAVNPEQREIMSKFGDKIRNIHRTEMN